MPLPPSKLAAPAGVQKAPEPRSKPAAAPVAAAPKAAPAAAPPLQAAWPARRPARPDGLVAAALPTPVRATAAKLPLLLPAMGLPASELLIEQIIAQMRDLDDPHAQPEFDGLPFTPNAHRFVCRRVDALPLWGRNEAVNFRQVRFDLHHIGAALASLAAADPQAILQLVAGLGATAEGPADASQLYTVQLNLQRLGALDGPSPVHMVLDNCLPADERGNLLGLPGSAKQPADLAAWPYILAKSLLKFFRVLQLSHPTGRGAATWANATLALSGRRSRRLDLRAAGHDAAGRALLHQMAESFALRDGSDPQSRRGRPGSVVFCNMDELAGAPALHASKLEGVLGGLGLRVLLLRGILDFFLLSHHTYSIVGFDRSTAPTQVLLYNPLGYNPQSAQRPPKLRAANFFVPEDLAALPKAQGTLWLPIEALLALGKTLWVAD